MCRKGGEKCGSSYIAALSRMSATPPCVLFCHPRRVCAAVGPLVEGSAPLHDSCVRRDTAWQPEGDGLPLYHPLVAENSSYKWMG